MAQTKENTRDIGAAFYLRSPSDGNCSPLSREELRQLIEEEFKDVMENPQDPKTIKKVLRFLDDDRNRRVDFRELLSLVFRTAKACYKPLQPGQGQEDGQEPAEEEKAGGEQPSGLRTAGRVSHNQQQGETPKQDKDKRQTQQGETPKQDQDKRQTQQGETPKQDQDKRQTQEGEAPKKDQDKRQTQEGETPKQDQFKCQTQQGETKKQDNHQDGRTGAPQGNPKRGETPDTATPRQDRNTHKAEETKAPKQDPKPHQTKETEAPQQGSKHRQSPETESAEKDLNCPSETQGRDPKDKTQVTNPHKTQKLLPPQRGTSPRRDHPKPQGTHHDPAFRWLPESKVLEEQQSGAEAPSRPAQQHQDTHQHKKPIIDQQVLQSLYQWPPQQ
ncbi:CRNN protein, partial [Rostratula benghalensis]|nr:CRNN protein [Rostratula benghalensis]